MSEETTQTPAPSGDSQESKKQTVRISLPPKPAAAPTIKIAVPPAGAAKTAEDSGKAASTIKIPVPPKTAKPGVGVAKPAAAKAAAGLGGRLIRTVCFFDSCESPLGAGVCVVSSDIVKLSLKWAREPR